jgi:hypothetical protein
VDRFSASQSIQRKNVCEILNFLDKKPFNAIKLKIDHSEHNQKNNVLMLNSEQAFLSYPHCTVKKIMFKAG